jgi:hypothetical protein
MGNALNPLGRPITEFCGIGVGELHLKLIVRPYLQSRKKEFGVLFDVLEVDGRFESIIGHSHYGAVSFEIKPKSRQLDGS